MAATKTSRFRGSALLYNGGELCWNTMGSAYTVDMWSGDAPYPAEPAYHAYYTDLGQAVEDVRSWRLWPGESLPALPAA